MRPLPRPSFMPRTPCAASDYRYLVGKSVEEARNIKGVGYRVVTSGSEPRDPYRLPVLIDRDSRIIRQIACG